VHPDVVGTEGRFYGTALTMVMEPYPFGDQSLENPSIVVSDDGVSWTEPLGVTNPIVGSFRTTWGWYSDAALFQPDRRSLHLYYRYNSGLGETTLLRRKTEDGLVWSTPQIVLRCPVSGRFASPSIVCQEDAALVLIYVDTLDGSIEMLRGSKSPEWGPPERLATIPAAWHVAAISHRGQLYLLLTDRRCLYLLRRLRDGFLQLLNGRRWVSLPVLEGHLHTHCEPLLKPSQRGWDSAMLYRGSFLIDDGMIRVWYSAVSPDNQWHIGYTYGNIPE
jgi:hypothetical protein